MPKVRELRLVITSEDFDRAVRFYRDSLGLPEIANFSSDEGKVVLLEAGRATLEISDPGNAAFIDEVEVGRRVAGPIRVAFEVDDTMEATRILESAGAKVLGAPRKTPFNSVNARLETADGLQLTLFEPEEGRPETWVGGSGEPKAG